MERNSGGIVVGLRWGYRKMLKLRGIVWDFFRLRNEGHRFPFDTARPLPPDAPELLKSIVERLEGLGIHAQLSWGTALGIHRGGAFIPHDNDFDIDLVDVPDWRKVHAAMRQMDMTLGRYVFHRRRRFGRREIQQLVYYTPEHVIVDFCFWKTDSEEEFLENYVEEGAVLLLQRRFFTETTTLRFHGKDFRLPRDIEGYLERIYGPDWKIPQAAKGKWQLSCPALYPLSRAVRWLPDRPRDRRVAIVVPFHTSVLKDEEKISALLLTSLLGRYDTFLVLPKGMKSPLPALPVKRFPASCFRGVHTYNQLLLTRGFYRAYAAYDYILLYQLDCLVFSDQLLAWCDRGYDYVGAPWIRVSEDGKIALGAVGNGGFSLRKVSTFLTVLSRFDRPFQRMQRRLAFVLGAVTRLFRYTRASFLLLLAERDTSSLFRRSLQQTTRALREAKPEYGAEDYFWSFQAQRFLPSFSIAPAEVALSFSMEREPRFCFEKNHHVLPFGCHNWTFYDRTFWEEILKLAGLDGNRQSPIPAS